MRTLTELAIKHGTDKHGHHNYCEHYAKHFNSFRHEGIIFLEMGIGGYKYPGRGGAGLKMWRDYFTKASVIGIDFYDKGQINFSDVAPLHVYKCSQEDETQLKSIFERHGTPSIIVDDASHNNKLTIESFNILFPLLLPGGIYVIEDIESSWWENEEFSGCANYTDFNAHTTINLIRRLMDDVCYKSIPNYKRKFPVKAIHLYENIVFIEKEENHV